ncbi:protein GVQW3 [Trichonephila clavipes]|nr:protein GVQW3 [Trichonephila clavipes]
MMKTAFGDEAMSCARVFEWFRRFKDGCHPVNSDPRSGRPYTSRNEDKIAQVKAVVRSDRRLTVREIAQECHISVGSCDKILRKDLNMRRVSAKFVPRLLTEDKQFQQLATSSDLFQSASDDPEFMKLIITGDESWVYGYDPETKQQSSQWKTLGSPRPKKARQDWWYCRTHNLLQVPIAELAERWTELPQVSDESRSFFRVHTGYFSNIPKCIKAAFIASWACSQSSVVSSSQR